MLQLGPYTLPKPVWLHVAYLTLQGLQLAVFSDTQDTLSGIGLLGIASGCTRDCHTVQVVFSADSTFSDVVTARVHPDVCQYALYS